MVLMNVRFQHDTPGGLVDVHAFVQDNEAGGYDVYCKHPKAEPQTVNVPTMEAAVDAMHRILRCCAKEVRILQ